MKKPYIIIILIIRCSVPNLYCSIEKPIEFPKDTLERLQISFNYGQGFLSGYAETPAVIRAYRAKYGVEYNELFSQNLPDDYINRSIELGLKRYLNNGLVVAGRVTLTQLHESYSQVYWSPGNWEEYNLWIQHNFVSTGASLGYDFTKYKNLSKELRVVLLGGVNGRIPINYRLRGDIKIPLYGESDVSEMNILKYYDVNELYLDPVMEAYIKFSYLSVGVRIQGFRINALKSIEDGGENLVDRIKLTTVLFGLTF